MIRPGFFVDSLKAHGVDFYAGVPDSLLKSLCAYITDHLPSRQNIIAANEGGAVGLAAGYHLATGKTAVVYMQNSGEGNAVNPLASLMDRDVYNMPVLLVIGWRGRPGVHDEPQHVKQGKITLDLLRTMGIPFAVLSKQENEVQKQIDEAIDFMRQRSEPYALVVEKDTFEPYQLQNNIVTALPMSREEAIGIVAEHIQKDACIVSTTGMISRELFEHRTTKGEGHERDFLTVGSMGHASQIALGIALHRPSCNVYCFDGDGASIMHMGNMAIVAQMKPTNFVHVVFNNGAHDSVGGQPTVGFDINLPKIAEAVGYNAVFSVANRESLLEVLNQIGCESGPVFLEIQVRKGNRKDLGRPTTTPIENKQALMNFLSLRFSQQIHLGINALNGALEGCRKVMLVCDGSYDFLSIKPSIEALGQQIVRFSQFTSNPLYEDVCKGVEMFRREQCDAIIAVGGGSAIDVAKCIKLFCKMPQGSLYLKEPFADTGVPLVAIPTTAGTGSESTRFAVIYYNGQKQSIAHNSLIPNTAILESGVLETLPLYQKKCTMMDALCQGIESWWSVNSTPYSRQLSQLAVENIIKWWREYLFDNTPAAASHIMVAANCAGQAINITQTTAPHAFSYKLTSLYGLPHGHAVALSLPHIWRYMLANMGECIDCRGEAYLADIFGSIAKSMGANTPQQAISTFEDIMQKLELERPISQQPAADLQTLSTSVNPIRLRNNPVELSQDAIRSIYSKIIQ